MKVDLVGIKCTTPIIFLVLIVICACSPKINVVKTEGKVVLHDFSVADTRSIDTVSLVLKGIDLSEDVSVISTQNDEILILIYSYPVESTSEILSSPLLTKSLVIDKGTREREISWWISRKERNERLLILLIEQDANTPIEQLDPVIRLHHEAIVKSYLTHDYSRLEKYLGDEDLLGVGLIKPEKKLENTTFNFKGSHKLDKYEYSIKFIERG